MLLGVSAGFINGVSEDIAKFTDDIDLFWVSLEWLP